MYTEKSFYVNKNHHSVNIVLIKSSSSHRKKKVQDHSGSRRYTNYEKKKKKTFTSLKNVKTIGLSNNHNLFRLREAIPTRAPNTCDFISKIK